MHLSRAEAKTIHAGIHFDKNFDRARQCRSLEHFDLLHMVHYNGEPARGDLGQLVVGEKTLQQEDAACVVALAQRNGAIELEQRQSVGFRESRKNAFDPVTVSVRFDDRQ